MYLGADTLYNCSVWKDIKCGCVLTILQTARESCDVMNVRFSIAVGCILDTMRPHMCMCTMCKPTYQVSSLQPRCDTMAAAQHRTLMWYYQQGEREG